MRNLFFAFLLWPRFCLGDLVSNTTKLTKGIVRIHYNTKDPYPCSSVVLVGVGTTMKVDEYDKIALEIVTSKAGMVVGILDHEPRNPLKISVTKYSNLVNSLVAEMGDIFPPCRRKEGSTFWHHPHSKIILGGHSASGGAAIKSFPLLRGFAPAGYIGLSPFRVTDAMERINIPSLLWGFSHTTCGVSIGHAADKAYELSNATNGRVLYQVQNPNGEPSHCIFANNGCLPVCPSPSFQGFEWIRNAVGESVARFLDGIESRTFTRQSLELHLPNEKRGVLKMFVNEDRIFASRNHPMVQPY